MSRLNVKAVSTRGERKQFLEFPWKLYRADPNWIPPLRANQAAMVGYKRHPFYNYAKIQTFLATRDGEPVGRIAAIVNPRHIERFQDPRGMFGFFECQDDLEAAQGLFAAARQWLADQGLHAIRGPINPSLNYEVGLLIDGFDSPPTFMMTYNPPYYAGLIEQCGFHKCQDLYAFWGKVGMLNSLDKKLDFVVREVISRFNVTLRRLDKRRFAEEVRTFLNIYNQSLVGTWGFTPLSDEELEFMSGEMKHLVVPELTTIAEVDGKPVAAAFGLLDYNPRIKAIDGRLFPFGFLRLLWNRKKIDKLRLISTNVLPEYQRWGLGVVVLSRLVPEILDWGIREVEFSWVLESNDLSRKSLQRGGAKLIKTYRIYDSNEPGRIAGPSATGGPTGGPTDGPTSGPPDGAPANVAP
jgi:GNAT superfamily N-acetyltransferase